MPFQEVSRNHQRQQLAYQVLVEHVPVAVAARAFGVSRPTATKWVDRARADGLEQLAERSRRPHQSPRATSSEVVAQVLAAKATHPHWGAKKLHAVLWPDGQAPVCVRTVDRLLERHGLVTPRGPKQEATQRFERGRPNDLWQLDFKGLERCWGYSPLSVLDDHSRFCLALRPLPDHTVETLWGALWEVFGEHGLPAELLCDNEPTFHAPDALGPSQFEARLWRLGIRTTHGRPYHPQTQGKVERFHRTLELEWSTALRQPSLAAAIASCEQARQAYNWRRPHEAVGQRPPGTVYQGSSRPRPDRLPPHEPPEGALTRKVDASGKFSYGNRLHRAGAGLQGETVELREEEHGLAAYYVGVRIAALDKLEV